ncbi:hypothetical protein HO173_008102 [Letharia columbiana]|uniref:Uncharacterized protein n=1 Tax=Letharia columbiana TaxID=112416 RepID=A0A8H6L385_9LECA|nr:uncharacterized protein HO173_008102 [Letharia columbiana]KAF6233890.1 hypothetical protein HO173_008102 [Letharia columbiana]
MSFFSVSARGVTSSATTRGAGSRLTGPGSGEDGVDLRVIVAESAESGSEWRAVGIGALDEVAEGCVEDGGGEEGEEEEEEDGVAGPGLVVVVVVEGVEERDAELPRLRSDNRSAGWVEPCAGS